MLFTPFTINGKLKLRNRIVLAPLYLALDGRSDEVVDLTPFVL